MHVSRLTRRLTTLALASALSLTIIATSADAQNPAPAAAPPSPSKQAVENRRAIYTLIGNYFRWFGGVAKGTIPYDEAEATKRANRIAFLAGLVSENFPEASNVGEPESKAKADIWSNRADFDKKLNEFVEHANSFASLNAKEKSATDALKAAVASLGQDCKGCHETYKAK